MSGPVDITAMGLAELAAATRSGQLDLKQMHLERDRRRAAGLDPATGAPPLPSVACDRPIPAVRCRCCGALSPAPASFEVSK